LGATALKVAIASTVTGAAVLLSAPWIAGWAGVFRTWDELLMVLAGGLLGLAVYGVMAWVLRVEEVGYLRKAKGDRLASTAGCRSR
jgi:peptidoglycan biosynthesis protein MviN/MurJ (putative lipid II flippase)